MTPFIDPTRGPLCTGKAPAKHDPKGRTLKLSDIFKDLPPIPDSYDFDLIRPGCDVPMFLNNELGCCVMAGRAHHTRRMELIEQGEVITIQDSEVKGEYLTETGGSDSGLVVLDSLNAWRKGWTAAGQNYSIDAYGRVDPKNVQNIKTAIYLLDGVGFGVQLPLRAQTQLTAGEAWHLPTWRERLTGLGQDGAGSWGGHYMYAVGYDQEGVIFLTWGGREKGTWGWVAEYADECFGIVDAIDTWKQTAQPSIDIPKLEEYLGQVEAS